jgi:hypothetical protein
MSTHAHIVQGLAEPVRTRPAHWHTRWYSTSRLPLRLAVVLSAAVLCLVYLGSPQLVYAGGKVRFVRGNTSVVDTDGQQRVLKRGDRINAGDTLRTGSRSRVAVKFDDGSKFSLGANSRFRVDKFKFGNKPSASDGMSFRILRGAFRFVSGLLGRRNPRSVALRLGGVATIGIRGTVVGGEFDGAAKIVLLPPEDPSRKSAIEVFNAAGSVVIDEPGFGTDVVDANTAPTPPRRMRLRTVENLTRTIRNIGRTAPRPRVRH